MGYKGTSARFGSFIKAWNQYGYIVDGAVKESIKASSCGLKRSATTPRLSSRCMNFDAPMMMMLTTGFDSSQANATCDTLTLCLAAIGRMLSTGTKDAAIARELGLSLRTVRAEVSALVVGLGAKSRFQAGCLLVRRFG